MANQEKDEAQSAVYREIVRQVDGGVSAQQLHHLAEAYALVTIPSRSSAGAAESTK